MEQLAVGLAEGEICKMTIPSHLAYGARGHPPVIPPHADLTFEIRVNSIVCAQPSVPATGGTAPTQPTAPAATDPTELERQRAKRIYEAKLQFAAPLGAPPGSRFMR